jgi:hypothetical protein
LAISGCTKLQSIEKLLAPASRITVGEPGTGAVDVQLAAADIGEPSRELADLSEKRESQQEYCPHTRQRNASSAEPQARSATLHSSSP